MITRLTHNKHFRLFIIITLITAIIIAVNNMTRCEIVEYTITSEDVSTDTEVQNNNKHYNSDDRFNTTP